MKFNLHVPNKQGGLPLLSLPTSTPSWLGSLALFLLERTSLGHQSRSHSICNPRTSAATGHRGSQQVQKQVTAALITTV